MPATTPLFTNDRYDPLLGKIAEACEAAGLDPDSVAIASTRKGEDYALVIFDGPRGEGNALTPDFLRGLDEATFASIIERLQERLREPPTKATHMVAT